MLAFRLRPLPLVFGGVVIVASVFAVILALVFRITASIGFKNFIAIKTYTIGAFIMIMLWFIVL